MRLPRASGILLHPTSLPGPHGSGDLGAAAHHFVDWLAAAGQRLWQVLPLGGIGAGHSPYMSASAFAGNVLLIDLADLAAQGWLSDEELIAPASFEPRRVVFDAVVPWRMERLARAAARFAAGASADDAARHAAFCAAAARWLDDYALFMALDEAHGGVPWCDWPAALARREKGALEQARARLAGRIAFWKFCQWRFAEQWTRLRSHAHARDVRLFGDAPIFIAWQSADVWTHPELFELGAAGRPTVVAGVPPDYFSATGQRWGNPLYRWRAHAADGHAWWIARVRHLFEWLDVLRIDHFRGFAAHWEIAADEPTAIHGRWVDGPGAALFEAIERALGEKPIVAEDLGLITPDVDALRRRFALPGMRVLQFAFADDGRNRYLPHQHERDSVVYVGTHDNDTARGWWASATEAERQHARDYLATDAREIEWDLMRAASASVANTAILTLQDVLGLGSEARMNTPALGAGCWAWRFEWTQVAPWHAERLAAMARLYGRG
jgi:4-alpha-glucanotransferase